MHTDSDVERHEQGVLVDSQFRREDRCDAIRPVDPRLPFGPRQLEYVGNGLCPIDQFPFELGGRTLLVCALTTSLTVRACSSEAPPVDSAGAAGSGVSRGRARGDSTAVGVALIGAAFRADTVFRAHSRSALFGSIVPSGSGVMRPLSIAFLTAT